MKYFMENANGRTLFLLMNWEVAVIQISARLCRSDPGRTGKKHAYGIVTTHYLNLKSWPIKHPASSTVLWLLMKEFIAII
jgi:hypothetical protein